MKKFLPFLTILIISTVTFTVAYSQPDIPLDLGKDTTLCRGSQIVLDAGLLEGYELSYEWGGIPQPPPPLNTQFLTVISAGKYWVRVWLTEMPHIEAKDTIELIEVDVPEFRILYPVADYFCKGEQVELMPDITTANWMYEWEIDGKISLTANAFADTTGTCILTVTDENNCVTVKSVDLEFQFPWEEDKILLATWDPEEKKNIVVWKKTPDKRTLSYIMFRGNDPDTQFSNVAFEEVNLVVDYEWDPGAGPAIYNCILKDVCENLSPVKLDLAHKTLHLTVEITAEKEAKLTWTPYEGFDYPSFDILRGTKPESMEAIKTIENTGEGIYTYIDPDGGSDMFYYQVRINTPDEIVLITQPDKKAGAGPFVHSFSNLEDNQHSTAVNDLIVENDLAVYPNPYSGHTTIRYSLKQPGNVNIAVYNLLGQRVASLFTGMQETGTWSMPFSLRKYGQPAGMYYLKMEIEGTGVVIRKIIEK